MVARMLLASMLLSSQPAIAAKAQLPVSSSAPGQDYWATLDEKVLLAPAVNSGLSANVGEYYYAYGSPEAVDASALADRRVASHGRLHVFHLPPGSASMLQIQSSTARGGRRSSMSDLIQLQQGAKLSAAGFPVYKHSEDYVNPLDKEGQKLEKAAVAEVTAEAILDNLKALTTLPMGTRSWSNPEAGKQAVEFLQKQFEKMGLQTCVQNFEYSTKLANIVAFIPGPADLDATAGSVTIGAHYDSRPFTGAAPGAEDNGSGVAALLAIAKAYVDSGVKPAKPLYFVGFAGEEAGMLGSKRFAQALTNLGDTSLPAECRPEQVRKMSFLQKKSLSKSQLERNLGLIMDEIGWRSPKLDTDTEHHNTDTVNLETYDREGDLRFIDTLAHSSLDHNGDTLQLVHNSNPFGSDHMSWLDSNMVGALTINADDDGYPNYHKETDTIENVTPEYAAKIAKMNMGALMRFAGIANKK